MFNPLELLDWPFLPCFTNISMCIKYNKKNKRRKWYVYFTHKQEKKTFFSFSENVAFGDLILKTRRSEVINVKHKRDAMKNKLNHT